MIINFPKQWDFLRPVSIGNMIRIGDNGDGGYVIPELVIEKVDTLVSLGIGSNWSFDENFRKLNSKISVCAYDYSISSKRFKSLAFKSLIRALFFKEDFNFFLKRWNYYRNFNKFFDGVLIKHYPLRIYNPKLYAFDITFNELIQSINGREIFLKVDIEGSEYRIIQQIINARDRILAIAIEFHDIGPLKSTFENAIKSLKDHYHITHVHVNNGGGIYEADTPEVIEITLVRKNSFSAVSEARIELPINGLDWPNVSGEQDYVIKFACDLPQ